MVRVTFLHHDLGIVGDAERLLVDTALVLKQSGHDVDFVTTHHDSKNSFTGSWNDTFPVRVVGDWLPRDILGKLVAFCTCIRMIWAIFYIIIKPDRPDIVFCDLGCVYIAMLKLRIPEVICYHNADQLLTSSETTCKNLYHMPLSKYQYHEEVATSDAVKVFVKSLCTKSVPKAFMEKVHVLTLESILDKRLFPDMCFLFSINRYERKTQFETAIRLLAELKKFLTQEEYDKVYLIMVGDRYDERVEENVAYYLELIGLADELGVSEKVYFLRSPTDIEKVSHFMNCDIVIHTTPDEHFSIVPLEAMDAFKPVIAHNSEGAKKLVVDSVTGYLFESLDISEKLATLIKNKAIRLQYGASGKQRFVEKFSFGAFISNRNSVIRNAYTRISENRKLRKYMRIEDKVFGILYFLVVGYGCMDILMNGPDSVPVSLCTLLKARIFPTEKV